MKLTDDQKVLLSQRIYDVLSEFYDKELSYQVEAMKDLDELDWDYNVTPEDSEEVYKMLQDLIMAVTVE